MDQSIEEVLKPVAPASYLYLGSFYDYQNQRIVFMPNSTDVNQNLVFYDCVNKTFDTYSSNIEPTDLQPGNFYYWGGAYHIGLNYFFLAPGSQRDKSFFHYYDPRSRNFQKYAKPSTFTGNNIPPINFGAVYNPHNGGEIIFINGDNGTSPELPGRLKILRLRTIPSVSVDPFLASHYLFSAGF